MPVSMMYWRRWEEERDWRGGSVERRRSGEVRE
jgi:hypothetical protein